MGDAHHVGTAGRGGEIADGIILTRSTLQTGGLVKTQLATGAALTNRDPSKIEVTSLLPVAVAKSRAEALNAMRPGLMFYIGFFPRYRKMISDYGFPEETAAVAEAFARGDREGAIRNVTDNMIDASSIVGTPAQCQKKIKDYRASGIDLPIISPFARGPNAKTSFEAAIRACAPRQSKART